MALHYIPKVWREVKVVFIPNSGRESYAEVSSFLLKVLKRLIYRYIRDAVLIDRPPSPPICLPTSANWPYTRLFAE